MESCIGAEAGWTMKNSELLKEKLESPGLEKYKKQLLKIEAEGKKIEKVISKIGSFRKKKKTSAKKK